MRFDRVEATKTNGEALSMEGGVYKVSWRDNLSQVIRVVPVINDGGRPQEVRLVTTIKDPELYSLDSEESPTSVTNVFVSSEKFTFDIRLRRNSANPGLPCRISNTLYWKVQRKNAPALRKQETLEEYLFVK